MSLPPSGWAHVRVNDHVVRRYLLRVCSDTTNPLADVQRAWFTSEPATADDLYRLSIRCDPGCRYRFGKAPNGVRFVMICRGNSIVTILEVNFHKDSPGELA